MWSANLTLLNSVADHCSGHSIPCHRRAASHQFAVDALLTGRRARFAKNIRKQIMMVRRKLSMQKRKIEAADAKSQDQGVCWLDMCRDRTASFVIGRLAFERVSVDLKVLTSRCSILFPC